MRDIYGYLGMEIPRPVVATLKLLASMAGTSLSIAKEVFHSFNWNWKVFSSHLQLLTLFQAIWCISR